MTLQRPSDKVNQHPYEYGVIIDGADPLTRISHQGA